MNDKLVKEIRDAINFSGYTKEYYRSLLQRCLVDSGEDRLEEYNRGAEDAWGLARKIAIMPSVGGYTTTELDDIFGSDYEPRIFESNSGLEALAKVEAYEKKKKEEAEKEIKVGDVVRHSDVIGCGPMTFIVSYMDNNEIKGLFDNGSTCTFTYPNSHITKTGKHVDIQGMLDEIKTEG